MAAFTNYAENKIVDFLWRGKPLTPPATWYVALFTATPSDTGGGIEVSGGSYARQALASSTTNWASTGGPTTTTDPSAGTSGTTSNNAVLTFPAPTADWGQVTHIGLFDASTGGNLWIHGAATAPLTVTSGGSPYTIPISALTVQIDN